MGLTKKVCGWLGAVIAVSGMTLAQQIPAKHPFAAKDWAALRSAGAAAVSPDGTILYQVNFGGDTGPTRKEWWTIAADGNHAVKLALPEDFSPKGFTHDGCSLYGAWKVNKIEQLAIFPLEDGKSPSVPSTVVLLPRGIQTVKPSPDGKRFAIVADPRLPDQLEEVRHVYEPDLTSLYVVNTDGTGGEWWCSSLKSISEITWSSDASSIALLSGSPRIGHHDVSTSIDVCGTNGAHHLADIPNAAASIGWTNSGHEIAFLSTKSAVLTPEHVWTVPVAGGNPEDRTPNLDGTALQLASDVRGRLWVFVDRGVRSEIDEFKNGTLNPIYRWPDGVLSGVPISAEYTSASEQMTLTVGDPSHSRNVAVPEGDHLRKITHESDEQLVATELGDVKVVQWKSKDGIALEGIATFPAGYVTGQKYPFLVLPHGGPEANDELTFDPLARIIAGLGYVVLQPEYRGSTGYGADFLAAIYQHFDDRAYKDVDSATDYTIAQGWADPSRLAIFGWSAGGFMTSWTATQTNRYKAAIEGAGITDWSPFLWTSDIEQIDYDARWTDENPDAFRQFSAVAFANKVTTPLLILHGEADQRMPTFQGVEFFQILAARGKTVRLVTYPGSPHFPTLWEQRLNVVQEMTDWLAKYNK